MAAQYRHTQLDTQTHTEGEQADTHRHKHTHRDSTTQQSTGLVVHERLRLCTGHTSTLQTTARQRAARVLYCLMCSLCMCACVCVCVSCTQACLPDDAPEWMREMAAKMGELEEQVVSANKENYELRQQVSWTHTRIHTHTHMCARARST